MAAAREEFVLFDDVQKKTGILSRGSNARE
jgi:hypothetical protein